MFIKRKLLLSDMPLRCILQVGWFAYVLRLNMQGIKRSIVQPEHQGHVAYMALELCR